jgi:hypothetical protein
MSYRPSLASNSSFSRATEGRLDRWPYRRRTVVGLVLLIMSIVSCSAELPVQQGRDANGHPETIDKDALPARNDKDTAGVTANPFHTPTTTIDLSTAEAQTSNNNAPEDHTTATDLHQPDVLVTAMLAPPPPTRIPQLPTVEQLEEPVVDVALEKPDVATLIHTCEVDSSAATDPPDVLTTTALVPTDIPQLPNAEQVTEPVVDAAQEDVTTRNVANNSSQPLASSTDLHPDVLTTAKLVPTEIPQLPNAEQIVEPVVDAAQPTDRLPFASSTDSHPDVLITTKLLPTEIPQLPNAEQLVEPVADAAVAQATTITEALQTRDRSLQNSVEQPNVLTSSSVVRTEIPQPPNSEQYVEESIDVGRPRDGIADSNSSLASAADMVEMVNTNLALDNGTSQQLNHSESTEKSDFDASEREGGAIPFEADTSEEQTPASGKLKAQSVELLENVNSKDVQSKTDSSVSPRLPVVTMNSADDANPFDLPLCSVWGRGSSGNHRTLVASSLRDLVRDDASHAGTHSDSDAPLKDPSSDRAVNATTGETTNQQASTEAVPEKSSTPEQRELKPPNNEFVAGLDDIDNLFEGIDPPDELDVGVDGTSIQEVLMGSATRVLLKRISVGFGFIKDRVVRATHGLVNQMQVQVKKLKPMQRLATAKQEFASLNALTNANGDFAPFRQLRDESGNLKLPSKAHLVDTAKWVQRSTLNIYHRLESFLDKVFEGGETDEMDFKFVSMTGHMNKSLEDAR